MPLRPDDLALYERLAEDVAAQRLCQHLRLPQGSGGTGGLFSALGVERSTALEAVMAGHLDAVVRRLCEGAGRGSLPPVAIHHVAVLFGQAWEVAATEDLAIELGVAHLRAWCRLTEKQDYLADFASRVSADHAGIAVDGTLPRRALDDIGRAAREAYAKGGSNPGPAVPIVILERVAATERSTFGGYARTVAERLFEDLAAPHLEALEEAKAQENYALAEGALSALAALWKWGGRPLSLETLTLEVAEFFLWAWTKKDAEEERMKRVLLRIEPLIDHLAERIAPSRGGGERGEEIPFAWAALAAQALVFLDAALPAHRRLENAERGVRVCSTHRNARSRLAWHRAQAARPLIELGTHPALASALALLDEGAALFPASQAVRETREQWTVAAARVGFAPHNREGKRL